MKSAEEPMVQYRLVEKKDNAALATIIRNVFEEFDAERQDTVYDDPTTDNLYELCQHDRAELWVAEYKGKVLGSCGIYPTEGLPADCAELVKYYLSSEARGKGIGARLLQLSIDSAKRMGYTQIYLESFPQFEKAVSIYERLGFKVLEKPMGNSGHKACTLWMIKSIAQLP